MKNFIILYYIQCFFSNNVFSKILYKKQLMNTRKTRVLLGQNSVMYEIEIF